MLDLVQPRRLVDERRKRGWEIIRGMRVAEHPGGPSRSMPPGCRSRFRRTLRDRGVELLGGAAELQSLQAGELRVQLVDRGREQHPLQERDIVRQRGRIDRLRSSLAGAAKAIRGAIG
jgi:hypothetical protein